MAQHMVYVGESTKHTYPASVDVLLSLNVNKVRIVDRVVLIFYIFIGFFVY